MASKFCPKCEAYREFHDESRREVYWSEGVRVPFDVRVEICDTCGESLFNEERDAAILKECAVVRDRVRAERRRQS